MLDFLARDKKLALTNAELQSRTEIMAIEIARLRARIDALEKTADQAPATAPITNLDDARTPRKLMAFIGRAMGNTSADTAHLPIRQALLKSDKFAQLRDALARKDIAITDDVPTLKWLAGRSRISDEPRYALIARGAYTVRSLAVADSGS